MVYEILIEEKLKETLGWLYKKDRKRYEICMKKIEEIVTNPEHYKPLRHDMKTIRRVHIAKSFVLTFKIEGSLISFLDLEHHDKVYR